MTLLYDSRETYNTDVSASITVGEKFLVRTIRICSILRRSVLEPRPNGLTARNERSI